jgi:SsrA-binding protein
VTENIKIIANNRKASFEYFLMEKFEAGLVLHGSEIKSIRAGQISIQEAYVDVPNAQEAWLLESHIAPYEQAGTHFNHEPKRKRKLLLHKKQIREIWNEIRIKGMTVVPTRVYLKDGRAKIEIALAKGKKAYDKRATIAKRDDERNNERASRVR